ncbi:MAG: arginine--tRNA ligase [Thermoleophilaceae bacterium]|nr:arginine--tRNA ligase [Thermoleophilaceae bacterium]MDQ3356640.1 arginine--tRNA ligase [Actinomycetota bacterium]
MASLDPPPPSAPAPATGADPLAGLRLALAEAAAELHGAPATVELRLDRPKRPEFGDFSSNAPLLLAAGLDEQPRAVAERLGEALGRRLGPDLDRHEVAGPGFVNLFLSDRFWRSALSAVAEAGRNFGSGVAGTDAERMLVEFVSANPTGPLTVAAARHAAYGDSLCRILAFAGHAVEREYYVNDAGGQIRRFGESLAARARGQAPPEDGYHGAYVGELAARIAGAAKLDPDELAARGIELMLETVRATLERFRVHFDRFFSERSLHSGGAIERALELLSDGEHVYASEGATWLRTSVLGDDKDRVLRRSSGELTYFAADVAYHADKLSRGPDRVIDVLGADHHGHVARMQAAWQALGGAPDGLELLIMQLVNLTEGGRRVAMSKREGEFVTLDELIDDIGLDAARWFLLQRSHDTTLDLDLALAREQTQENPVYYVQYAHARIAAILRRAGEERLGAAARAELAAGGAPLHASERALVRSLLEFPAEIVTSAVRRAPHRLTAYALELAQGFSAFYRDCRVVGAEEEGGDEAFRIALSRSVQATLARCLDLLGVEAPESM